MYYFYCAIRNNSNLELGVGWERINRIIFQSRPNERDKLILKRKHVKTESQQKHKIKTNMSKKQNHLNSDKSNLILIFFC